MPIRRPPSGIPFLAVIFRMSFPAFSLMCSILRGPQPRPEESYFTARCIPGASFKSVAGEGGIYLVDPAQDTAGQVHGPGEPVAPQESDRAGAAPARLAMDDDFVSRIELV